VRILETVIERSILICKSSDSLTECDWHLCKSFFALWLHFADFLMIDSIELLEDEEEDDDDEDEEDDDEESKVELYVVMH